MPLASNADLIPFAKKGFLLQSLKFLFSVIKTAIFNGKIHILYFFITFNNLFFVAYHSFVMALITEIIALSY